VREIAGEQEWYSHRMRRAPTCSAADVGACAGLLSTTTGWPTSLLNSSAMMRARKSPLPPGGNPDHEPQRTVRIALEPAPPSKRP